MDSLSAPLEPRPTDGPLDVLVIGAGQAGLVMGYHLSQRGRRFRIVDAGSHIGDTWRGRWDSLTLFTAAQYDDLPGMKFPAPHDTYPGKDDVADFLQRYAIEQHLPVTLDTKIASLRFDGHFKAETAGGAIEANNVVIATGPFQCPRIPALADDLAADMFSVHSIDYRRPGDVPSGKVLVVGAANTGCQIALELSATHQVEISAGHHLPTIPQRQWGRDIWWWGTHIGLTRVTAESRIGKRLASRDQVIGGGLRELKRHGVVERPRLASASGRSVTFSDGSSAEYDAVIWATGFTMDHSWVEIPDAKNAEGSIAHERGVTGVPGLYMLGLTWQHRRTSALLGWVTKDAEFLADHIESRSLKPLAGAHS